jgi:hypothetical protein
MKEKFINLPTILGFLLGLFLLGIGWMLRQKETFNDPQRNRFNAAMALVRESDHGRDHTDEEKLAMESNAGLTFQNSLISWEEAKDLQKKSWLYWLRILPGPDDLCAARAKFQIGNCLYNSKQLDQAEAAFAAYPMRFPGGQGDPFSEIWHLDINNLEVVRNSQKKQEQKEGKDGKSGKDKKNKKQGKEPKDPEPEKPDDQAAGKGSIRKI